VKEIQTMTDKEIDFIAKEFAQEVVKAFIANCTLLVASGKDTGVVDKRIFSMVLHKYRRRIKSHLEIAMPLAAAQVLNYHFNKKDDLKNEEN
jgi:hypothetical protein